MINNRFFFGSRSWRIILFYIPLEYCTRVSFLSSNWDPPPPRKQVYLPLDPGGGATLSCGRWGGGPNSDDWIESMALCTICGQDGFSKFLILCEVKASWSKYHSVSAGSFLADCLSIWLSLCWLRCTLSITMRWLRLSTEIFTLCCLRVTRICHDSVMCTFQGKSDETLTL